MGCTSSISAKKQNRKVQDDNHMKNNINSTNKRVELKEEPSKILSRNKTI